MLPRRRCPFCRRWFHPHARLKQRQKTCGRTDCRRKQKRKSDQQWRTEHPDYFRDTYALQKEKYGTRAGYKRLQSRWVSFLAELLDIRFFHELEVARNELVARDLIAYAGGIYQVLDLPVRSSEDVWLSKLGSPAKLGT